MKKRNLYISAGFVVLLIVIIIISFLFSFKKSSSSTPSNSSATIPSPTQSTDFPSPTRYSVNPGITIPPYNTKSVVQFNNSVYSKYSYLVYPGSLSPETKAALGNFTITTQPLASDVMLVTLHINQRGYDDVNVVAKSGQQVYFVKLANYEDPGDAGLVLVDQNGVIVQQ